MALILIGSTFAIGKPAEAEYSLLGLYDRSTSGSASPASVDPQTGGRAATGPNLQALGSLRGVFSGSTRGVAGRLDGGSSASALGSSSSGLTGKSSGDIVGARSTGAPAASGVGADLASSFSSALGTQSSTSDGQNGYGGASPLGLSGAGGSTGSSFDPKHNPTPLASPSIGGGGANANPLVVDAKGNIYSTTTTSGPGSPSATPGKGSVFSFSSQTGAVKNLAPLDPALGSLTSLALDPSGNLYAISSRGGAGNSGLIVELKKGTSEFSKVLDIGASGHGIVSIVSVKKQGDINGLTANGTPVELKPLSGTNSTGNPISATDSSHGAQASASIGAAGHVGYGYHGIVPEIDPLASQSGLTLLLGGLLIAGDSIARQRRSSRVPEGC